MRSLNRFVQLFSETGCRMFLVEAGAYFEKMAVEGIRIHNSSGDMDTLVDDQVAIAVNKMLSWSKYAGCLELRHLVFDNLR